MPVAETATGTSFSSFSFSSVDLPIALLDAFKSRIEVFMETNMIIGGACQTLRNLRHAANSTGK